MTTSIAEKFQQAYHTISLAHKAGQSLKTMHAYAPSFFALVDIVAERGSNRMQSGDTLFFRPVFANANMIQSATLRIWGIHEDSLLHLAQDIIADPDHPSSAEIISFSAKPHNRPPVFKHRIRHSSVYLVAAEALLAMHRMGPSKIITVNPALCWAKDYVAAVEAGKTPKIPANGLIFTTPYALKAGA